MSFKVKRRLLVLILSIAMLVTLPVNMNWFIGEIEAYAETSNIDLSSNTTNGFVSNISFSYNVKSAGSSDEIILLDSVSILTAKVSLTSQKILDDGALYLSIYVNGSLVKSNRKEQTKITKAETTAYGLNNRDYPAGEVTNLSIVVGRINDENNYTDYDVYNYKVSRALTLKSLQIKKEEGDTLPISPAYNAKALPMEKEYSTVYEGDNVYLDLAATTTGAQIYVGNSLYDAGKAIDLSEYTEEGSDIAKIPVSVQYEGSKTEYTLYISKTDYTPVIAEQPQNKAVDKDSPQPLTIDVNAPEKGQLSYQWYKVGLSEATPIQGATAGSYQPPVTYAGTQKYKCIVTNTVNGVGFQSSSDTVNYTVNLSEPTAPEFVLQPRQSPNSNNGSRIFYENGTPEIEVGPIYGDTDYIEGLEYNVQLYRNSIDSTEGGTLIECTSSARELSAIMGKTYKKYTFQVPSQNVTGTWYYYATVTVEKDGRSDVSVSQTLPLTFKSVADVVKGLEGDGSESSPFLLHNSDDLLYVKSLVEGKNGAAYNFSGQTLAFADNISLPHDWEPIGNLKAGTESESSGVNIQPFSGIIDGKGYTLTMGDHGKPLLNYVRKATVKNLNLAGTYIDGYGLVDCYTVDYGENGVYVNDPVKLRSIDIENVTIKSGTNILKSGFIGGFASGVNAVNIRNCTIEAGVIIGDSGVWGDLGDTSYGYGFISEGFNHQDNIGSFAGAFNGTITNSVSYATVYGRKNVGGLVGMKGQSMGSCDILNSSFQGKIIATGDKVGGIVGAGYISGSAPGTPTVEIHNCYVNAEIQGNDKIGGLVGSEEGHEKFNDTGDSYGIKGANSISDNHFYGTITAGEDAKNVGGILGYVHDFSKKSGEATNFYLDSCGATKGIGGAVEGTMEGVEKYAAAASAEEFADGTVLTKMNASATSYQNWELKAGSKYPTTSDKPVVTSLSIEGDYKSEYVLGEDLDLTDMKIYANWSDKTKTELEIGKDVTCSGYNKNVRGLQTITFQYKAIKATIGVTVLKPVTNPDEKITVSITIYGDKIHNSDQEGETSHTLSDGNLTTWISGESYQVDVNATVWDLLQEVQKKHSSEIKFHNKGNYIDYLYYDSSKSGKFDNSTYLGEFTNGKMSGWMYTLNGTHPLLGVEEQFLNNRDAIIWHYTDDYTKEEGSDKWNTPGAIEEVKDVTTDTKTGITTAPTEVKVTEKANADGTKAKVAEVKVTADNQKEILKQAKENKSKEIILSVATKAAQDATKAEVTLDKSFIDSIVKDTDAKLTVKTPFGDKTYTQDELKALSEAATGSTVTITVEKAAEPTEDAKLAQAKALTAKISLTARSTKTAKKNVKVTIKTGKASAAAIQELKDMGYTVKYKFYRSMKKGSKYAAKLTKSGKTYINTTGVKGKQYYYKARVMVYDEDGKLITYSKLTQCKYASRQWTKAK